MDVDLEQLGERIAEQSAHLDAATHRLLTDLREFDQRGGWFKQGAKTCAHWLSWRIGWGMGTARDHVRVANKLGELPLIDDALRRGVVSYSNVRAMTRVATPANESYLLEVSRFMTAAHVETMCRKLGFVQRHSKNPHPIADEHRRHVRRRDTEDGMVKIEAVLHPEEAERVWAMLDHAASELSREPAPDDSAEAPVLDSWHAVADQASEPESRSAHDSAESSGRQDSNPDPRNDSAEASGAGDLASRPHEEVLASEGTDSQDEHDLTSSTAPVRAVQTQGALHQRELAVRRAFNRADALMAVADAYLRGDSPHRAPIDVVLTIPKSALHDASDPMEIGEMGESFVSGEAARRICCDAGVVEVVEDEKGVPLSVGRKQRTVNGPLKRALRERDRTCRFPGCTHRLFLDGHHIKHWIDGGETSLENTLLLCGFHHTHVHEYGYTIEMGPDQQPLFRNPYGCVVRTAPERPRPADLGWERIRAGNAGLGISANTNRSKWDGKPIDCRPVIVELLRCEERARRSAAWVV